RRNRSGRTVHMRTDADADRPSRTVDGVVPTFVQPARSHRSGHWFDPRRVSDNAVGAGEGYGVAALGHTEFAVDRSDVRLDGVDGYAEFGGDLGGSQHGGQVAHDLCFALAQSLAGPGRCGLV